MTPRMLSAALACLLSPAIFANDDNITQALLNVKQDEQYDWVIVSEPTSGLYVQFSVNDGELHYNFPIERVYSADAEPQGRAQYFNEPCPSLSNPVKDNNFPLNIHRDGIAKVLVRFALSDQLNCAVSRDANGEIISYFTEYDDQFSLPRQQYSEFVKAMFFDAYGLDRSSSIQFELGAF